MLTSSNPLNQTRNIPANKFAWWAGDVAEEACVHLGATPVLCSAVLKGDWIGPTCCFTQY